MARIEGIKKRLEKNNTDEKTIKEIIGDGDLVNIIKRMEKSLKPDIMHEILGSCACTGGKKYLNYCENIGKEIAGKTLKEKVDFLNKDSDSEKIILRSTNTMAFILSNKDDNKYKCVCSATVKKGIKVADLTLKNNNSDDCVMPLSYCFCCAGSMRLHLQLKLGIELKAKEIVSSPINSKGKKPCEILFEIIS
jgi:hypothetical protein